MEYFIDSVIYQNKVKRKDATHFAITNNGKVRYYVAINKRGKKVLSANLSSYSKKLEMLMKLLVTIPFALLKIIGLGYYVTLTITNEVEVYIRDTAKRYFKSDNAVYNVIVGNYVDKQKIVFQCFVSQDKVIYFKVGGKNSASEMQAEMGYLESNLSENYNHKTFDVPKLVAFQKIAKDKSFNIQVTEEFKGDKVEPILTDEIYAIFQEIAASHKSKTVGDIECFFSHGDLVPWNIKKNRNQYIVYDWEYCGCRFYGYDLIHYLYQININLNKMKPLAAVADAIKEAKHKCRKLESISDSKLCEMYFQDLKNTFG